MCIFISLYIYVSLHGHHVCTPAEALPGNTDTATIYAPRGGTWEKRVLVAEGGEKTSQKAARAEGKEVGEREG